MSFPTCRCLANFEFYYHAHGVDVGFDPEFVSIFNDPSRLRARNGINLLAFQAADWGHSATHWQRGLYPAEMQPRISVLHEGVDTELARPKPNARFKLPVSGQVLTRRDEVVTYVARNLEPYRGFHIFMRSLPQLLAPAQARAGRDRRRRRRQLRRAAAAALHLSGDDAPGTRRKLDLIARALSRHARLPGLPEPAAGLLGARLSDLSVRAVLVVRSRPWPAAA